MCLYDLGVNGTKKKLTIVIPTLDEGNEPEQTIKSIYDTASVDLFDIIVIDDASNYLSTIASQLSERANSDINMRKHLRESSEICNLLVLKESRTLLRNGAKALQADGFVKESHIAELDSILSGFSEQNISAQESIKIKPVSTQSELEQCYVKFHVYDEQSHPIDAAELDLGGTVIRTDSCGSVEVNLTKSIYEAVVKAVGFKTKSIEFRLDSYDDVVIPVILSPLPAEERLAHISLCGYLLSSSCLLV